MTNLLCKLFDHKWTPGYIIGEYNGIHVKFIGCYCSRCFFGYDELIETIKAQTVQKVSATDESYFAEKYEIKLEVNFGI